MAQGFGRRAAIAGLGTGVLPHRARAQADAAWPVRPVRIVVPFTPGGSNDAMARPLAERLQARFGQPFVIENRPGAGSAVGVTMVAQSAPDGHTLLVTTSSVAAIAAVQGTSFDAAAELDTVALLAKSPLVVLVRPDSPVRSMQDLVRMDRDRPGTLTFASSGPGSTTHIMTELFNLRAGTRLTHVPYRGTAPALTDVVAGRVDLMFTTIASAAGQIRGNLLRIVAYTDDGLPAGVRTRLNAAVNETLRDPAFARYLAGEGAVPAPMPPEEFDAFLRREIATLREVVAAARIRAD